MLLIFSVGAGCFVLGFLAAIYFDAWMDRQDAKGLPVRLNRVEGHMEILR